MLKDLLEGKPLRYPIHPMLVHFPIGFFVLSFILDLVSLAPSPRPFLVPAAFYAMLLGIITALLAAIPGFVDYTDIRRDHPGKGAATAHMSLNLIMVAVYAINLWIRASALTEPRVGWLPLIFSFIGVSLLSASGYLGGTPGLRRRNRGRASQTSNTNAAEDASSFNDSRGKKQRRELRSRARSGTVARWRNVAG